MKYIFGAFGVSPLPANVDIVALWAQLGTMLVAAGCTPPTMDAGGSGIYSANLGMRQIFTNIPKPPANVPASTDRTPFDFSNVGSPLPPPAAAETGWRYEWYGIDPNTKQAIVGRPTNKDYPSYKFAGVRPAGGVSPAPINVWAPTGAARDLLAQVLSGKIDEINVNSFTEPPSGWILVCKTSGPDRGVGVHSPEHTFANWVTLLQDAIGAGLVLGTFGYADTAGA